MPVKDRALIPFTNEHFVEFCKKMLGQPYWYGCVMYKCSDALLKRKTNQYPSHYSSSRTARYKQDISAKKVAADCIGASKGYAWTGGGVGVVESIGTDRTFTNNYGANGCPDKSANGMFTYAKSKGMEWGNIGTLPEIVGLALHKDGHVGYYIGNGYAIEWRGYKYGCVKTKVSGRGWSYWYKLPFIKYGAISAINPDAEVPVSDTPVIVAVRYLKHKSGQPLLSGDDVIKLQTDLNAIGYDCGGIDGVYGKKTEAAVKMYQNANNLEVDGIVGPKTRSALEKTLLSVLEHFENENGKAQTNADEHTESTANIGEAPSVALTDVDQPGASAQTDKKEPSDVNEMPFDAKEEPSKINVTPSEKNDNTSEPNNELDYGVRLLCYRPGSAMLTGVDVTAVQTRLLQLGFTPGAIDGVYGPKTVNAVKALQTIAGVYVDGIVGDDTRKALIEQRDYGETGGV